MNPEHILHILRNSYDASERKQREARLAAAEDKCSQCFKDNDSREHLDICESCGVQNKMDELKRGDNTNGS